MNSNSSKINAAMGVSIRSASSSRPMNRNESAHKTPSRRRPTHQFETGSYGTVIEFKEVARENGVQFTVDCDTSTGRKVWTCAIYS